MAQLRISGLAELQKEIAKIAELDGGQLAKEMLKEGSKDVKKKWEEEVRVLHRQTGRMLENVKSSRVKKNKYGHFTVTYPMESETRIRRGQMIEFRHAEKAFYMHYGWTNNRNGKFYQGDRFVELIDIKAEAEATRTMQKIWDDYLRKISKK